MRNLGSFLLLVVAVACSRDDDAGGAPPPPSKVVEWSGSAGNPRPAPGGGLIVDVAVRAAVEPGWKLYSLTQGGGGPVAMTVRLDSLSDYSLAGEVRGPAAVKSMDPNFAIETETYSGEPAFTVPVHIPPTADKTRPIEVKVRSQACSDKLCLPARTITVSVPAPTEGA